MTTSWFFLIHTELRRTVNHTSDLISDSFLFIARYNTKFLAHLINPLNAELNPICPLIALFEAHHILNVSRQWVNIQFKVIISLHLVRTFFLGT